MSAQSLQPELLSQKRSLKKNFPFPLSFSFYRNLQIGTPFVNLKLTKKAADSQVAELIHAQIIGELLVFMSRQTISL